MNVKQLRTLRALLYMSRRQFAEKIGVSFKLVYLMENGQRSITDATLNKINRTFNRQLIEKAKEVATELNEINRKES
ncbi:helix-turn-helix domain-containing protein [Salipaludibacillus sp. CUR1]|uniref:helix-turn-helix domain-containing protein n=1 Tax=Salipaludibacillus sp. CUR1 TaxID=2820003 RepID=UPI001E45D44C|nr:helix-turn-helix transcriptional regulator [Salipaludibacillus sp. CUR1]MCE7792633.1 helix-turn-helix domain-containing protein [Salipaludibacillus sp. CUR1]